jgi:acyl-CoA oxidase
VRSAFFHIEAVVPHVLGLGSELFQGKYELPKPKYPESLLARHEAGLLCEAQNLLQPLPNGHRDDLFDGRISLKCRPFIEAVGQRIAYEVALDSPTTRPELLDLYEVQCMKSDLAWYVENAGYKSQQIFDLEDERLNRTLPLLDDILDANNVGSVVTAPILSEMKWQKFVATLPKF